MAQEQNPCTCGAPLSPLITEREHLKTHSLEPVAAKRRVLGLNAKKRYRVSRHTTAKTQKVTEIMI